MTLTDRALGWAALALGVLAAACGGDETAFKGGDSGTSDTDTGTDTDADTDTDTDTGESEVPPDLPALCSAGVFNTETSGDGDGRTPVVACGASSALIAWPYDPQDEELPEQWRIQATPYDPLATAIAPVEPFSISEVALSPAMAVRESGFGIVWLDSRWDSTLECDADPDDCAVELAFAALDGTGAAAAADPVRTTTGGAARSRPAIAGTPDGWLAAWAEVVDLETRLVAVALGSDGTPGTPHVVSGDAGGLGSADVAIAAGGDLAVAVWSGEGMESVVAQAVSFDGTPVGEPAIVDQGVQIRGPRIAAGGEGFLVAWSRRSVEDFEIFARLLDDTGAPAGEPNRLTWTISHESGAAPAWDGARFGVFWLGNRANGTEECVNVDCEDQAFASVLDADGALASVPVLLSDNANPSSNGDLAWDGSGWTAVWEVRRDMRQQVFRGRMVCD